MYEFEDDSLVICSNKIKEKILRYNTENKKLIRISFLTEHELLEHFYFKITKKAYVEAMSYLGLNYENSKIITDNIYYLFKSDYNDDKLDKLNKLKQHLDGLGMLEYDPFFIKQLQRKKVFVYLETFDNLTKKLLEDVGKYTEVIYYDFPLEQRNLAYKYFANYYEEVDDLFFNINALYKSGVSLDKIIIITDASYYHILRRYSYFYQIPINILPSESIISSKEFKTFYQMLEKGNIDFEKLSKGCNEAIFSKILNLYNEFYFISDYQVLKEVIYSEAKRIKYPQNELSNAVSVRNIDSSFEDDEYVFLLNFSSGFLPKIEIDDNFLSDKYADIIPITTAKTRNENNRKRSILKLSEIKNLVLSFSRFTQEEKIPSSLIRLLNMNKIEPKLNEGLSLLRDKIRYGILMDKYQTYGIFDEALANLNATFYSLYNSFDNRFKGIDKELLKQKLMYKVADDENVPTIRLSYSAISDFYKCQFAYYLKNILRIYVESDKSAAHLGTAYHAILQNIGHEGFELEAEISKQAGTLENIKEKFYYYKNIDNVKTVYNFIFDMRDNTSLTDELYEREIIIDHTDNEFLYRFKGFIDKIIYKEIDGVSYLAIIDYKTGSDIASLDNIDLGFNLQLPIYAYLIVKSNLFKNPKILGIYLEPFMKGQEFTSPSQTIADIRWKASMLEGYTLDNNALISLLDRTYTNSKYIKNLKVTNKGFSNLAKLIKDEDIKAIIGITERLINDAYASISRGEFIINPKIIDEKNKSCTFCDYKDICFFKNKDTVRLKSYFNLKSEKEAI